MPLIDRRERLSASSTVEGRYRLLIDAIVDYAICMLDVDGRVTSWNVGAERFKGYRAEEIIGEHFSRFYPEEERRAGTPERALRTAVEEGRFECEGWRLRKDGGRFWAHVVIDPIWSPEGELLGFAKITRDLSERKAAADALRRNEEQFRLLVQGVTDHAIFMLDPEGRVASWNPGAERIKGYREEEILGEHFSRFYVEEDRAAGAPEIALRTALEEGRFSKEGWRRRKDGSRFRASVVIDPIRDELGRLIGFAKITRDITERDEAQRALEQARETLFQAQKLDALGQLTGGVAHDFNNLLMAILGSLELVKKRLPEDPRITPLIENAILGAQRGAALTRRMLTFARKQEMQAEAVDLRALVTGMTALLERSLDPSLRIDVRIPSSLPCVRTDPNQLETALLNLALNARDAMPDGGAILIDAAEVTVGPNARIGLPPGPYVRLSVTDDGQGMDEETLARATEPFFTTKEVGRGTGLGLSMVHGLAEQSGGRLSLRSWPGQGTVVELMLPQAGAEDVRDDGSPRSDDGSEPIEPLTVLAVDDDSLVLLNSVSMMEEEGHRVLPARSGAEALELLAQNHVDLVVTDYAMPQMNGVELGEAVRLLRPDTPIIVASGFAELPPDTSGGIARLAKPFRIEDLNRIIRRVRARRPAAAQEP